MTSERFSFGNESKWKEFWKKTPQERLQIAEYPKFGDLSLSTQRSYCENYVSDLPVPFGLALYAKIDGAEYAIPMATEEPSVVAACCKGMKLIYRNSSEGFTTALHPQSKNIAEAQIYIQVDQDSIDAVRLLLVSQKERLIEIGNEYCSVMCERGGGVTDVSVRSIEDHVSDALIVHVKIDVCESMGANCCNTVAEGLANRLDKSMLPTGARTLFRIVTNYTTERLVNATFRARLGEEIGRELAERIVRLSQWSQHDHYRAVTNNKGIYNGIDAVALATGQDTRAIQAAGHLHASLSHSTARYTSLTKFEIDGEEFLIGRIEIPLPVGIVGGATSGNPTARQNLAFLQVKDASQLARIMACVGLAQNFAALLAIAGDGIQRGHMTLHCKNLMIAAGIPESFHPQVAQEMQQTKRYSRKDSLIAYERALLKKQNGSPQ